MEARPNPTRTMPQTLFDKIWDAHVVSRTDDGDVLLYVDRCLVHEGSSHAFERLAAEARPDQVLAFSDHYVPTTERHLGVEGVRDAAIRGMIEKLQANAQRHRIRLYGIDDPQHGILHVVPPELGITQPGILLVGADSHTSTHGALGAIAVALRENIVE